MRARKGHARRRARKRLFKDVKGAFLRRGNTVKLASETLVRARQFAFRDRRAKKRTMRALWITRVSAACEARGMSYSRFINGLSRAECGLNRKSLSEIAIFHPGAFDELVKLAQAQLA
jgi:large subunit ribosomal protein L20